MDAHETKVLLVGAGRGGLALLQLLNRQQQVKVVGVVDVSPDARGIGLARQMGVPTGTDYRQFLEFAERGEIDLIINVTGKLDVQQDLLAACPVHVEVMGGHSAKLMWDLVELGRDR
jgi:acetaldehyde dehydrogenase (acetylating)